MSTEKWFSEILESFKDDFDFRLEGLIFDLTEHICKTMKDKNIKRKQLAEILKVSPAAVSKILNGNSNFTIRTLLSLADALKTELKIEFKEKGIATFDADYTTASQAIQTKRAIPSDTADYPRIDPWIIDKEQRPTSSF